MSGEGDFLTAQSTERGGSWEEVEPACPLAQDGRVFPDVGHPVLNLRKSQAKRMSWCPWLEDQAYIPLDSTVYVLSAVPISF